MSLDLWCERFRPGIDSYVWANPELRQRVDKWVKHPETFQHLIFAGHPGIGKTSLAILIAEQMGLEKNDGYVVFPVEGSTMHELIDKVKNFCDSGFHPRKVVIIDEGDRLTDTIQRDLRPVADKYQRQGVGFIITCNDAGKLKTFIGSRQILVEFKALDADQFMERLAEIGFEAGVDLEDPTSAEVFDSICKQAYPDLRQAINLMQYSCIDNKLIPGAKASNDREWHVEMLAGVQSLKISFLRDTLQGLRRDELATAYRVLVESSHVFGKNEGEAVQEIAEAMFRHGSAEYPDITVLALIIKLHGLYKSR